MRVSELLIAVANWLENENNEAILLAEHDEASLQATVKACISAAAILKMGAEEVEAIEPKEESKLTPEALDHLNSVVSSLDASQNADFQKSAALIDELLLTLAAPPQWADLSKEAQENRLDVLKAKYEDTKKELDKMNNVVQSAEAIDKSSMFKDIRIMEAPLSTRSCPDHAGALLARVGEHMWQCQMDKKVYNWTTGFTNERGEKIPGGEVSAQAPANVEPHTIFDTRESRLNGYDRK